jgi:predicted phosphodiesterase
MRRLLLMAATPLLLVASACPRQDPSGIPAAPLREPARKGRGPWTHVQGPTSAVVGFETPEEAAGAVLVDGRRFQGPKARRHGILVEGLKPATRYAYRIEPGDAGGSFLTPPEGDGDLFFVLWGDSRTHADRLERIAARAAADRPDFTVHSGDLVDDGDVEADWDVFFDAARPLLEAGSFWPAMGNHEEGSKIYLELFRLPEPERWYAFRWGCAEFFVVDSNYGIRDDAAQNAWLKASLAASRARFKFVVTHYPVVSGSYAGFDFGGERSPFEGWRRLFEAHGVDAVLQGHNHNYQRHELNGVVYLTSGGAGAPLYELGAGSPERKAAAKVNHYVRVRIRGRLCSFEAVDIDGKIIDRREIEASR